MQDSLHERGKAMEDLFYAETDKKLLDKMRAELSAQESRAGLQVATGISDLSVLDALTESGITPETLTSVALIPLIAVAWADNVLDDNEKKAILQAADGAGIESGSASFATIETWMNKQPQPELLATWKAYIGSLKSTLDSAAFSQLKISVISRAENIAESAGGFLGLVNKISGSERKVLDELAKAFD